MLMAFKTPEVFMFLSTMESLPQIHKLVYVFLFFERNPKLPTIREAHGKDIDNEFGTFQWKVLNKLY